MINKLKFVLSVAVLLNLQWVVGVNSAERVKNIVETLVFVDMEFADLFENDYQKIADYLTVFFWDVNSRFKSLWSVDISLEIVDLVIIKSKEDQPFVENARGEDGKTYYETIFNLFRPWLYKNRDSLIKHDLSILITNSEGVNDFGIATVGGACYIDLECKEDSGAVVVYDIGKFKSMGVTAHEIGHSLGADHDDDEGCPKGFLMHSETASNVFFFSSCSDRSISKYVNSRNASCLRRIDAVKKTSIDTYFSTPKAGTMLEVCKSRFGGKAKIDKNDESDCRLLHCQSLDKHKQYVTHNLIETVENIQCVDNDIPGRCFRGKCRRESKLLQHVSSGNCAKPSGFGVSDAVVMVTCPSSRQITPLDTLEIMDSEDGGGVLLASPYLDDDNRQSGDKCLYIGEEETDHLWTEECDPAESWQIWNLKTVKKTDTFYLINGYTGKCLKPISNSSGSSVHSAECTSEKNLIWRWFDGQ